MNPYFGNIEDLTIQNTNFRQVLFTGQYCQLVVMSLKPGEEIGTEVHDTVDQFFRFEAGQGKVIVGEGEEHMVADGDAVVIPAGTKHNIINASPTEDLKLYTVYAPANHPDGTVHATKAEADAYEAAHHGGETEESAAGPMTEPVIAPVETQTPVSVEPTVLSGGPVPATNPTATPGTVPPTDPVVPEMVELPPDLPGAKPEEV